MNQKEQIPKSPWILCQSKSIPGKFYYFNVQTGVKAWCEDYERVKNAQNAHKMYEASQSISLDSLHRSCTSNTYKRHVTPGPYETPTSFKTPIFPHSPPRHVPNINTFMKHEGAIDSVASTSHAKPVRYNTQITSIENSPYNKTLPSNATLRRPQSNDMSTYYAQRSDYRNNIYSLRRNSTALSDLTYLENTDRQEIEDDNDARVFRHNIGENSCDETIPNIHPNEITKQKPKLDNYTLKITVDNRVNKEVEIENRSKDNPISFNNQETHVPSYYKSATLFGQSIFRNYISNESASNIIWAPIPVTIHTMCVQESQPNEKLVVDASGIPLSQRFANAARHDIILTRSEVFRKQNNPFNLVTVDSEAKPNIRSKARKACFKSESDKEDYITKSTQRLESEKRYCEEEIPNLGIDDLRHVILSKKKRNNYFPDSCSFEGKKIKTYKDAESGVRKSTKKVTFLDDSLEYEDENIQEEAVDTTSILKEGVWYVVVDGNTLTEEFEEIDKFVQSDSNCRLLITRRLKADVESMCFGDCGGQRNVIFARKITRILLSPPPHYMCLDEMNNIRKVNDNADIITCCIQLLRNKHVVILITNDTNIQSEARIFKIKCLKTCELSSYFSTPKPEVTFDLKKTNKPDENEIGGSFDSEDNYIPLYTLSSKHNLSFEERNDQYNNAKVKKVDATTSPVFNVFINNNTTLKDTRLKYNVETTNKSQTIFMKELIKDDGRVETTDSIFDITIEKDKNQDSDSKNAFQNFTSLFDIKKTILNEFQSDNNQNLNETRCCPIFERQRSIFEIEDNERDETSNYVENGNPSYVPQTTESKNNPLQFQIGIRYERNCMLECYLQKFEVKSDQMYEIIRNRLKEWQCLFEQIVEDALTEVLRKHDIFIGSTTQHEILKELILKIEELYFKNGELKYVRNKLFSLYDSESDGKGKLNSFMKPDDFIKLFGCGVILIQELKQTNPSYQELLDADIALQGILENLENSQEYIENKLESPTLDRMRMDVEIDKKPRQNFVKKRSDIIKYLKAHFDAWKYHTEDLEPTETNNEVKVFRTIGRNLGLLKLDNKSITVNNPAQHTGNTDVTNDKNVALPKNASKKVYNLDALDYDFCSNLTALSSESNVNQSKEKNSDVSIETSFVYDIKTGKPKKDVNITITSNIRIFKDDSGIGNENIQGVMIVKMFLSAISSSLKAIHGFIEMTIAQLKDDDIEEENISLLRNTANETHGSLACIIERLTKIIHREANERTSLKEVLLKAGLEASTDKKITRFRQVVIKCLEQARIMKSALKNILQVTEDDCQLSVSSYSVDSNLRPAIL